MPGIYKAPKLTFDSDFKALLKAKKADSKHLGKLAEAIKAALAAEAGAIEKHMAGLLKEAETAYKALEKLSLERNAARAGQKIDVEAKQHRDTVGTARKDAEASMKAFLEVSDSVEDMKDAAADAVASNKDVKELIAKADKYLDRHHTAIRLGRSQESAILSFDTKASAKVKEVLALTGAYAGDVQIFDKKIDALAKKCAAALESFKASCDRMTRANDKDEVKKHAEAAIKLAKALGPAVDAFTALANKHPDPARSTVGVDKLRKNLKDAVDATNRYGLSSLRAAISKLDKKTASTYVSDLDLKNVIARFK